MSSLNDFLSKLSNLGIKLWLEVDNDNALGKFKLKYNAPKGTMTPILLSELKKRKEEIIQFLQQANQSANKTSQTIQPAPKGIDLPLSFPQQRLWFLEQLEESSSTYNWARTLRLQGSLDIKALEKSINEIVRRHEVLRTAFVEIDGTPIQKICEPQAIKIEVLDLHNLPSEQKLEKARSLATQEQTKPFDLLSGLLIRAILIQLEPEDNLLVLTLHHIVADGWFMGIFLGELTALYQAFGDDQPSPLTELSIQYADFAYWQRKHFQGETLKKLVDYWKQELAGVPPLLELPSDRPRPPIQTFSGRTEWILIDRELKHKLKILTKQSGATLFMTLLTAFAVLLYRYSGKSDIVIGSPVANRNRSEVEGLIGFFVNSLALRIKIEENLTFTELLTQVKKVALEAYEHQDLPFEKLVEELKLERNLSYSPVFQTMFVLQNSPKGKLELSKLNLTELEPENVTAKFDLSLEIAEVEQGLAAGFEYNTDLFDTATIKRMTGHFQVLLEGIVTNPEQKVALLPLITQAEATQILRDWNEEPIAYHLCIHNLFETQVNRTPDDIAVKFENETLTYTELNNRANQLAHYLQTLGIEAETLVGICVERSPEMIVAVLAILKAGGAYVPLDPSYPAQRLEWMLEDSQVKVLLTTENLQAKLPEHQAKVVDLDTEGEKIATYPQNNLKNQVKPENIAYIIYTSGSTGKPKGVMIEHHSLASFSCSAVAEYAISPKDKVLQFASLSFDVAVEEIYPCLITGGTVVLRTDEMLNSLPTFVGRCKEWGVTVLDLPTAYWNQLTYELASSNLTLPKSVRLLIFGGEAANPETVRMWFDNIGEYPQLINAYGPTETTVEATTYKFPVGAKDLSPLQNREIPIGKPIANAQVYILDKHLQPLPIGIPGEIYIGGTGVARGYLNRDDLTKQKFIPNPIVETFHGTSLQDKRLYKTGDLGKYLPSGNIEYLGRIDNQVKIRGFRIELGEIETLLNQHPHLKQAVVIAREEVPGDKRLVAYVVPNQNQTFSNGEMRSFLKEKLPSYMIPSALVILERLPLTPNDKIDLSEIRKALPIPDYSLQDRDTTFVAPSNPVEQKLANIWTEILRVEKISIHDNFFELGGHSLLATQVMSRIRQNLSVELSLQTLFESPTIGELAQKVTAIDAETEVIAEIEPIKPVSREVNLPLSFAQQRLWFLSQLKPDSPAYNMPAAYQLKGNLDVNALEQSFQAIINRHEILRTKFIEVEGEPIQVIQSDNNWQLNLVDLTNTPQAETRVKALATSEAQQPFNLKEDSLIRAQLLILNATEHILLLNMHHIVSDEWSNNIFFSELITLYKAFIAGKASPLSTLPIQYADFAVWQRQKLQGEFLETEINYWKEKLGGTLPVLELPTDYPRPQVQTYNGANVFLELPNDLSQQIKSLSQESGVTSFMTLLTAFNTLLHRYSSQDDIMVGSPIAGRNHLETEGLIGFFVNTLALRTQFSENQSFKQLLEKVKNTVLEAYNHQEVPFERLVEELQPERDTSRSPLFQVMFVLQNAQAQNGDLELKDLSINPIGIDSHTTAKFDLTLFMFETAEGLKGIFEYNTDLFEAATIERMVGHFQTLLEGVVTNPEEKIALLPLLTKSEQEQLLTNHSPTKYPRHLCIHQLFEAQVAQNPDAVAVKFKAQELTYTELNQQANQLAHYLQSLGVKPDTLVGICLERSFEMIIAILAILKAGGAYVPFDAAYPAERLAFMLDDTQVNILLTQENLQAKLPPHQAKVICLDRDEIEQASVANLTSEVTADNLAYVMYTSGSTGKPKGVQVVHRGVVRLVKDTNYADLDEHLVFLQLAPVSFDASTLEIWGSLLNGGQLVLFPGNTPSLPELGQVIKQEQITTLWLTAGLFHLMVDEQLEGLTSLRQLLAGGDVLSVPHVQKFLQTAGNCKLINGYGPTENTTFTCCYEITQDTDFNHSIPIGRSINNTQVYILDRHLQPVPIGVPGELYIGGDGLARGYLNRDDLTKERFIPNPFSVNNQQSTINNQRLYKTGDLTRYLPDGNIEFLGRIDNQVKIRGFRIELGEIEAVLAQHPTVRENVVLAREDVPGDKRLVAYVLANQQEQTTTAELKVFLQDKLPNYMIPGIFVMVEEMPLTTNGKIDLSEIRKAGRRALPKPDVTQSQTEVTFVAPRDEIEVRLTKIWSKIFGIKQISLQDNFFELGGHSLLAVRLFASIEKSFKQRIPLAKIFTAPTIEQLANILRQQETSNQNSPIVPIQTQGNKTPLFCVHSGYGEILLYQNLAFRLDPDRPVYGLLAKGVDGSITPVTSIKEMATYYVEAIQALQAEGPYFLGGVCIGGTIAIEMARQLKAKGENVPLVALFGTAPLHFSEPPSIEPQSLRKIKSKGKKLTSYLNFVTELTLPEKIVHGVDQVYEKAQHYLYRGKQFVEPYQYKFDQRQGKPLTQNLQRFHVYQINSQAQNNFEQKIFDGQLISFWASLDERFSLEEQLSWVNVATRGVKLYDLPESHIERALNGPSIQNIVEILRQDLDAVEADINQAKAIEKDSLVCQLQQPKSWSSLIPIQPKGSKPPLFCIHGGEGVNPGEPLYGYDLARNLDSDQPIYGLRAVGLDGVTSPLNTIEAMAAKYLEEIQAVYPTGSYLLLGLDIGGLIAFEMAQQLSAQGKQVPLLAMINTLAPNSNYGSSKHSFVNFSEKIESWQQSIKIRSKETKCKFIRNFKHNSLSSDLRYFLIQQSLIQAQNKYHPKPYKSNLTLFSPQDITNNSLTDIGWGKFTNQKINTYNLIGNNTNIFKQPNINYLSRQLTECIDKSLDTNS